MQTRTIMHPLQNKYQLKNSGRYISRSNRSRPQTTRSRPAGLICLEGDLDLLTLPHLEAEPGELLHQPLRV